MNRESFRRGCGSVCGLAKALRVDVVLPPGVRECVTPRGLPAEETCHGQGALERKREERWENMWITARAFP